MTAVAAPAAATYPLREPWFGKRSNQILVVLGVWVALYLVLNGRSTFEDGQPTTAAQDWLQQMRDNIDEARLTNPFFV